MTISQNAQEASQSALYGPLSDEREPEGVEVYPVTIESEIDANAFVECLSGIGDSPRLFWLSFCDPEKPQGQQFLGVAIVEVTREDAALASIIVAMGFPNALPGAEWIAAASSVARQHGCNPGGEIQACELGPMFPTNVPRHTLLSKAQLEALGVAGDQES